MRQSPSNDPTRMQTEEVTDMSAAVTKETFKARSKSVIPSITVSHANTKPKFT